MSPRTQLLTLIFFVTPDLAEVFAGKKCHRPTFIKTSVLLFLNREISVKRAKGQGHRLGSKKLLILGFMAFCGNGCSERELLSGVREIALSRLWEEDN